MKWHCIKKEVLFNWPHLPQIFKILTSIDLAIQEVMDMSADKSCSFTICIESKLYNGVHKTVTRNIHSIKNLSVNLRF